MVVNKNSLNYCSTSDKSKRRTKTVKKSLEPKWNQTFMYSPVHRREFRERMLEITLWDQARVREEESEFLGEVGKPHPTYKGHSLIVSQLILLSGVKPVIKRSCSLEGPVEKLFSKTDGPRTSLGTVAQFTMLLYNFFEVGDLTIAFSRLTDLD